jgi:hypothetical protein
LEQPILRKALLLFSKKENRNFKPLAPLGRSDAPTPEKVHRAVVPLA